MINLKNSTVHRLPSDAARASSPPPPRLLYSDVLRPLVILFNIGDLMEVFVNTRFVLAKSCAAPFMISKRRLDGKDLIGREAVEYRLHVVPINIDEIFVYYQIDQIVPRWLVGTHYRS
jgi:hypothetical protein